MAKNKEDEITLEKLNILGESPYDNARSILARN